MPLTIRIFKHPVVDRRAAREQVWATAEADGYRPKELRKTSIRLERMDGSDSLEYVVEFPSALS